MLEILAEDEQSPIIDLASQIISNLHYATDSLFERAAKINCS